MYAAIRPAAFSNSLKLSSPSEPPEALDHATLISDRNRMAASAMVPGILAGIPCATPVCTALTALVALLVGMCDDHGITPEMVLHQVKGTLLA